MSVVLEGVAARHPAAPAGVHALEGIDLVVGDAERIAVIGPSGAGKTTLLSVCGLQLKPGAGRVTIDGIDPWRLSTRARQALRRTLFVAPQVPPLPARQRVVTAVLAGRLPLQSAWQALASLVHPRDAALARDALAPFGLDDKLWLRVDRLSGGERQRVSLARMLASAATLWLVDEPLSALDPTLAARALDAVLAEATARRATLVASLHQVDLAIGRFARIVGMANGRVAFDRPADAVDASLRSTLYGAEAPAPRPDVAGVAAAVGPAPGDGEGIVLPSRAA